MKIVLWFTFYFLAFLGFVVGMYMNKDKIVETTEQVPVLNYTQYHADADIVVEDSTYYETIDSLAVVIEGMLSELSEYVSQLNERDNQIHLKNREVNKLKQENDILKKQIKSSHEAKTDFNREQNEKKLQELASTMSTMKPEVLKPILSNMPDGVIQILYDKAKPKDRARIFNAIDPKRAGEIMSDMTKNVNRSD
jgi:flagellar motility protein MotE (MotC chaperone)